MKRRRPTDRHSPHTVLYRPQIEARDGQEDGQRQTDRQYHYMGEELGNYVHQNMGEELGNYVHQNYRSPEPPPRPNYGTDRQTE